VNLAARFMTQAPWSEIWLDDRIFATEALVQKSFETAICSIPVIITVKEIPAHLVNHDTYNQFGTLKRLAITV
jgi:hypothetical protein